MGNYKILNESNAVSVVLGALRKIGYRWDSKDISYINRGRYCIVRGNPPIAILLKRDIFYCYGIKFNEKGVGDSINVSCFKAFIREGINDLYTVFNDGKVYHAKLSEILPNSHRWMQKEGTEVRSFPLKLYKRIER